MEDGTRDIKPDIRTLRVNQEPAPQAVTNEDVQEIRKMLEEQSRTKSEIVEKLARLEESHARMEDNLRRFCEAVNAIGTILQKQQRRAIPEKIRVMLRPEEIEALEADEGLTVGKIGKLLAKLRREEEDIQLEGSIPPSSTPPRQYRCLYCKDPAHFSTYCSKMIGTEERRAKLVRERRCLRCLRQHCIECKYHRCDACWDPEHHTSICTKVETRWKLRKLIADLVELRNELK